MSAACTVRMTREELASRGQLSDVAAAPARPRVGAVNVIAGFAFNVLQGSQTEAGSHQGRSRSSLESATVCLPVARLV